MLEAFVLGRANRNVRQSVRDVPMDVKVDGDVTSDPQVFGTTTLYVRGNESMSKAVKCLFGPIGM